MRKRSGSKRRRVLCVFGTRPEAIKMAPVLAALQLDRRFTPLVCVTAQHRELLDQALSLFHIRPDRDLRLMRRDQRPASVLARAIPGLTRVCKELKPDLVLVQGDTTTTLAAALAAYHQRIPLGHIEAGLRTGDLRAPFPEEGNRRLVTALADLHFAPTQHARRNLLREGVAPKDIFVTGNTIVDALQNLTKAMRDPSCGRTVPLPRPGRRLVLVTAHRRESFGKGLAGICSAIKTLARRGDVDMLFPVHLNPDVRGPVNQVLEGVPRVHLSEPLDYLGFLQVMRLAHLILTDSGGVQEEAPSLGKPVLVLREKTDRPEVVSAGLARLVGTDPRRIAREAARLLDDPEAYRRMTRRKSPFGDGHAARRIVKVLSRA